MAEANGQASPGSDSGYSAGAEADPGCLVDGGGEAGLEDALERLNVGDFTPDQHVENTDSASTTSSGAQSDQDSNSVTSQDDDQTKPSLDIWRKDPRKVEENREKKKKENEKKRSFLQKIISKDKIQKHLPVIDFAKIKVDSLPQMFLAKYLGKRPTSSLYGVKHTRRHVEEMVKNATKLPPGSDLPLVILHVSKKGMFINEHKQNKNTEFEGGLIPIEFISYGVQDVKFFRIFSMIVVKQMSSRKKECECHAWACDSPVSARKLALSISMAFQEFSKTVKDIKSSVFKVDLRTPETAVQDLENDAECDA